MGLDGIAERGQALSDGQGWNSVVQSNRTDQSVWLVSISIPDWQVRCKGGNTDQYTVV